MAVLGRKIRVLIVDDSAVTRAALSRMIESTPDMEVVGTAMDAGIAKSKLIKLQPDVITLDLDLPPPAGQAPTGRLGGIDFLEWLQRDHPTPTIVVTGAIAAEDREAVFDLMQRGILDFVAKASGSRASIEELRDQLLYKVRGAAGAPVRRSTLRRSPRIEGPDARKHENPDQGRGACLRETEPEGPASRRPLLHAGLSRYSLVAIGVSTGGPSALSTLLTGLPSHTPPIAIVQHMPAHFMSRFAQRLSSDSGLRVVVAEHGALLHPGHAYLAPGGQHLAIRRQGSSYAAQCVDGPPRNHQKPSADILFESVAEAAGPAALGIIMTGMGRDGAEGLLAMRRAGAETAAQDESTSAIYGMAREAVKLGAVARILPLDRLARSIFE